MMITLRHLRARADGTARARLGNAPRGRASHRRVGRLAGLAAVALLAGLSTGVAGQQVRGRVVDEAMRRPVLDAEVFLSLQDGTVVATTVTSQDGYFQLSAPRPGTYRLTVERIGFTTESRSLSLQIDQDMVVPAFVLRTKAIELDSVSIEATRAPKPDADGVGFSRNSYTIAGERLATLERHGARMIAVLRQMPGIRVREVSASGYPVTCVEARRRLVAFSETRADNPCNNVVWVMDDIPTDNDWRQLRTFDVVDFESVEFLPPVEAGQRYGMLASTYGAVVLWSRGRGPHVSDARSVR